MLINTSKYKGNIISPVAKPSGTLTADDGKPYDIRAKTKGVVTLLYFGYTHCPDLCPLTMSNTAVAIRELPKADQSKVRVLFVSVDPYRDTLARLRSWLGNYNPAFIGLRGTLKQVEAFEQQTGLPDRPGVQRRRGPGPARPRDRDVRLRHRQRRARGVLPVHAAGRHGQRPQAPDRRGRSLLSSWSPVTTPDR